MLRMAEPKDFENIVDLVIDGCFQTDTLEVPDPQKVAIRIAQAFSKHPAFVIEDEERLVGVIILDDTAHWWNETPVIYNLICYILPTHRTFKLFKGLSELANEYAKLKGCEFNFSVVGVFDIGRKDKLLKRLGYKQIGSLYG